MTLSDLASIGSFISGIAVLVSLVYLAIQIRQSTRAQRAMGHQNRHDFAQQFLLKLSEEPTAAIFLRGAAGSADLTPTEALQYNALMRYWFLGISGVFWLRGKRHVRPRIRRRQHRSAAQPPERTGVPGGVGRVQEHVLAVLSKGRRQAHRGSAGHIRNA